MSLYAQIELPGKPALENVRRLDLLPVTQIRRMSRYGIAIDCEYLWDLGSQFASEMAQLQKDISSYIPADSLDRFVTAANAVEEVEGTAELNANSADQIRTLLFELLSVGRGKDLKLTSNGKVSTGKKSLELCRDDHPVVPLVLQYRERSKLKSAFTDSLPTKARLHPRGGCCPVCELPHATSTYRVHTEFMTTRAETGRLSSKNPNLQQIPQRTDLGAKIRLAFVASPGTKLVSVDFAQIELRDLAHLSSAASMRRVYEEDGDIHLFTAMSIFGIDDPDKVDKLHHRLPCKNVNFMIVYGAGAKGLQAQLALSGLVWDLDRCEAFINRWFDLYPEVKDFMERQYYRARRYGYVWCPLGRIRRVPEVQSCHPYIRSAGLRQAGNMPIQAMSAGQTKLAMAETDAAFDIYRQSDIWCWPLLSIHDQIIAEVDEKWAEEVKVTMQMIFDGVMNDRDSDECLSRVPIKSDGEVMSAWKKE